MTTLTAPRTPVKTNAGPARSRTCYSRVYEVRLARAVGTLELLEAPFYPMAGEFRGRYAALTGQRAFARYDKLADRVLVVMLDGRAFAVDGAEACTVLGCVKDAENRRVHDTPGAKAAFARYAAARAVPVIRPAAADPAPAPKPAREIPPAGAVFHPVEWAYGVLHDRSAPKSWADFARVILAAEDGYYDRPGAWIVPPPDARRPAPDRDLPESLRGAWGGYDDAPRR